MTKVLWIKKIFNGKIINTNELISKELKSGYTISVADANEFIELTNRLSNDYIVMIDKSKYRSKVKIMLYDGGCF